MDRNRRTDTSSSNRSEAEVPLDVLPLHSTNLLTVLDETGVVQYESPSIEQIYGYKQSDLVGEPVSEYFHPDDRERVMTAFQAVVDSEEGVTQAVEYRHKLADGTYLWVESVTSANTTPDGHYVINTRDISERKAREQELHRQNERLNRFVGVVSHDLRNPLAVADGRLELIADEYESEHIEAIRCAHDRMETLIEDLLTIARDGEQVHDREEVDIEDVVLTCWQDIGTDNATIAADVDLQVRADRTRLEQLLGNLLRNAVEHGGEHVTITIGMLDDGFYVEDDGPGIPTDDREQVFEAGYSTEQGGTGFGLGIVKRVVEAHDWNICITDGIDGGARFEITVI